MKPSNFKNLPMGSVLQKSEPETVARNIMVILARTGDEWRKLPYSEYEQEREKDGDYWIGEEKYFNQVIDFCISPDCAKLFSPVWKEVAERINK